MSVEGWKHFGLVKGPGLPAPSGQYTVGCVDLMHKLEGDSDGLLVRLFYPSLPQLREETGQYQYAKWMQHKRYLKGTNSFSRKSFPGLRAAVTNLVFGPRVPAFEGAPLYPQGAKPAVSSKATTETATAAAAGEKEGEDVTSSGREKDGGSSLGEEQQQSADSAQDQREQQSASAKPFPVVVFSHGLSAMRTVHSGLCCELASHGFVVASVEHRDGSGAVVLKRVPKPGGREGELMDEWMEYQRPESERDADFNPHNMQDVALRNEQVKKRLFDVRQALNLLELLNNGGDIQNMMEGGNTFDFGQFKGRLDVETAAIMGHSFGGSTTVLTVCEEPRFKCGIALDGWMVPFPEDFLERLSCQMPTLFINSYHWQWRENIQRILKLLQSSKDQGNDNCSVVTLKNSDHFHQTDVRFVMPEFIARTMPSTVWDNVIDTLAAHQVNIELCLAFLKRHLLKDPAYQQDVPNLDGGEGCSEHIIHGTNVDVTPPTEGGAETVTPPTEVEDKTERRESSVDPPGGQNDAGD